METELIKIIKSLADTTRMEILTYLRQESEIPCQELLKRFTLAQPTMSRHFNRLVDAKILNARKEGALWFYSLNRKTLKDIGINIDQLIDAFNEERG